MGLPEKGEVLSVNTVVHKDPAMSNNGTTFSIDLHNTVFANNDGKELTVTIGENNTFTLTGDGTGALSGKDLVDKLVAAIDEDGDGFCEINGQKCSVAAGTDGDNRITFVQQNVPNDEAGELDGDMKVTIEGEIGSKEGSSGEGAKKAVYTIDLANADATTLQNGAEIDGVVAEWDTNLKNSMEKFVTTYTGKGR